MHYLTLAELQRAARTTPGNEALADLLEQVVTVDSRHDDLGDNVVRVDLDKLLRKPEQTEGSLRQA